MGVLVLERGQSPSLDLLHDPAAGRLDLLDHVAGLEIATGVWLERRPLVAAAMHPELQEGAAAPALHHRGEAPEVGPGAAGERVEEEARVDVARLALEGVAGGCPE